MLSNIVRSAVLSLAMAFSTSCTTNNYYNYEGIQAKGCETQSDCRPVEDCERNSDLSTSVCYGSDGNVADYSDEVNEGGSGCGDSEVYGEEFFALRNCNIYRFGEDCSFNSIEVSDGQSDQTCTYSGNTINCDRTTLTMVHSYMTEQNTEGRENQFVIDCVNNLLDTYDGFLMQVDNDRLKWRSSVVLKLDDSDQCSEIRDECGS